MLNDLVLPEGLERTRTTPAFTAETVPSGLLSAHRVAVGVWGLLVVLEGTVTFVSEERDESRVLVAGDTQPIEPELSHHVELGADARFQVEFYR